jgi:hypothetical protein
MIAIHIHKDSSKKPRALLSIYLQPGKRWGISWRVPTFDAHALMFQRYSDDDLRRWRKVMF